MKISEETLIADVLKQSEKAAEVFARCKLSCPSCRGAGQDTIGKAALNNGLDVEEFIKELNEAIKTKSKK